MFFVAFAVFLSAAIYISPVFCGSNAEKKMISKPQEIESGKLMWNKSCQHFVICGFVDLSALFKLIG